MNDQYVGHLLDVASRRNMLGSARLNIVGSMFQASKKSRFSHFILAEPGFFDYAFNAFGKVPSALSVKRCVALEIAV